MNRRTSVLLLVFLIVVVGTALAVGLMGGQTASGTCHANGKVTAYRVVIRDGKVPSNHVQGKQCDTLTITNNDTLTREIAFGPHERHVAYDGVAERLLSKGQSLTVTLDKTGSFHWHDHLHDEVEGYFTVSK